MFSLSAVRPIAAGVSGVIASGAAVHFCPGGVFEVAANAAALTVLASIAGWAVGSVVNKVAGGEEEESRFGRLPVRVDTRGGWSTSDLGKVTPRPDFRDHWTTDYRRDD